MDRKRALSRPARALLAALLERHDRWSHGYELASLTAIKSGTLYPLLIRLETEGLLDAEWQKPVAAGRPPRHAYRLTAAGRRVARTEALEEPESVRRAEWRTGKAAS